MKNHLLRDNIYCNIIIFYCPLKVLQGTVKNIILACSFGDITHATYI
jgi:hypothetical protein